MLFNETIALFVCSNGKKNLILQQIYTNKGSTRAILGRFGHLNPYLSCPVEKQKNNEEIYN